MANTKISQLTATTTPTGSEELVYALNNANGKMTLNTMKTFATTGLQPELVSGTNIKTINGNDILGSGNIVISGGGGGGSTGVISLNAAENIDAGKLVSFTSAGVKRLRRGFYGTADTGISLSVGQNQYTQIDSAAVNADTTVVVYTDDNDNGYVVAIKRDGENRTVGTPVSVGTDIRFARISSPYTGEFVIAYGDFTGSGAVGAIAGSVLGTTITIGNKAQLLGEAPKQGGVGITRKNDNDSREFVVLYIKDSDSKIYYKICTYSSALSITGGTEGTYLSSTVEDGNFGVDYLGGGAAGVVFNTVSGGTYHIYVAYTNVTGSSISSSSRIYVYQGTLTGNLGFTPRSVRISDNVFLVDTGTDTTGLCLIGTYGLGRAIYLIDNIKNNLSPTIGRSYCVEDSDRGIIGMFGVEQIQQNYTILYNRYKGSDTGLELISSIRYGIGDFYDAPTVTRMGNTSCCSMLDYTNGKLINMLFQDESDIFLGINDATATAGSPVDVTYSGVATTAGLTAGLPMYIGLDGAISQTGADGGKQIGIATGSTDALLK